MDKIKPFVLTMLLIPGVAFACDLSKLVSTCEKKHVDNEQMTPVEYNELVESHCFDNQDLTANLVNDACENKLKEVNAETPNA